MMLKPRHWVAGSEARAIIEKHEADIREAIDRVYAVLGVEKNYPAVFMFAGAYFYGYQIPYGQEPLPGFRLSRKRGDHGIAVPAVRTAAGKAAAAKLREIHLPTPETLTKALCGEPWCYIALGHPGGAGPGHMMQSFCYAVERRGDDIIIVDHEDGLPPRGCTLLDEKN